MTPTGSALLAGRYELGDEIGRGGGGVVRRAHDRLTGESVAVKTVVADAQRSEVRARREAVALRLLRIPGIVVIRDEIVEGDDVHLVMDLVLGTAFPGPLPEVSWERIAPRVRALLEVLARVHAAGIVHRDLKPGNVLVDAQGRVTLLDFGVSWGAPLGPRMTQTDVIVGTPEYLAPEQLHGRGNDPRVDLYALGVMLYEILSGQPAFHGRDFAEIALQKKAGRVEPLERLAPQLPRAVARTVTALVSADPEERPQSARSAIHLLFPGSDAGADEAPFPRLGAAAALADVVAALRQGRSIDVHGEHGTGRTRLLSDASDAVRAEGRAIHWVCEGRSPYASLFNVIGRIEGLSARTRDDARGTVTRRVKEALARGDVVLADDPESIDPWSAEVLDACRPAGAVLRVVRAPTGGCVTTARFSESDLRALFAGPARLFHLPEDGAAELWRRTGGHPAAVRSEVSAWVRAGLAEWRAGSLSVSRGALDRLRSGALVGVGSSGAGRAAHPLSAEFDDVLAWVQMAWPHATVEQVAAASGRAVWIVDAILDALAADGAVQRLPRGAVVPLASSDALQRWPDEARRSAHRALADALPSGDLSRLRHLAAGAEPEAVVAEATQIARGLAGDGRTGDALVAADVAIEAASQSGDAGPAMTVRALESLAAVCLLVGTEVAVRHASLEAARTTASDSRIDALRPFLAAVVASFEEDPARGFALLSAMPELADAELELWRRVWIVRTADRMSGEARQRSAEEFGRWADTTDLPIARVHHAHFVARVRWQELRFAEAAAAYREVADSHPTARGRLAAMLNLGSVLMESGSLELAKDAAGRALRLAAERRNPLLEGFAESLLRDVAYASGAGGGADRELLDAVRALGDDTLVAWTHVREAAFAWRDGDPATAVSCARTASKAAADAANDGLLVLARCLEAACDGDADPARLLLLAGEAEALDNTRDGAEALALLVSVASPARAELRARFESVVARTGQARRDIRGTVLTFPELLALARRD